LKSPTVSGKGTHQTNGHIDMNINSISATSTVLNVANPEVELIGPPGNYTLTTIRAVTSDGIPLTYPSRSLNLSCNTTKSLDFPGPTLDVSTPQAEFLTNAQTLPVSGRAFGNSTICSVTVNGQAATLTPVTGGSPNEVNFIGELSLAEGDNLVTVTATDAAGLRPPTSFSYSRSLAADGSNCHPATATVLSTETSIPLSIEAADRAMATP
jgi:hypothetical protein